MNRKCTIDNEILTQRSLTGQLTKALLSAGSAPLRETSYSYDAMVHREFSHENSQNSQKETAYEPNSLNQYTSISTSVDFVPFVVNSLLYDANGNLTNDSVRAYTWDTQNQLERVEPLICTNGSLMVEFAYDCMGRRISKDVFEWDKGGDRFAEIARLAIRKKLIANGAKGR